MQRDRDARDGPLAEGGRPGLRGEVGFGGDEASFSFCIVPSLLLRAQRRLKLNPTQLAVLMQLCDYWWDSARKPYPSKESLAQRLGLSARQVQRHIADLERAGLVRRVPRNGSNGGKLSNTYDLSGLVARLRELEPEFRAVEEENRKRREAVSRPGLRSRAATAAAAP